MAVAVSPCTMAALIWSCTGETVALGQLISSRRRRSSSSMMATISGNSRSRASTSADVASRCGKTPLCASAPASISSFTIGASRRITA